MRGHGGSNASNRERSSEWVGKRDSDMTDVVRVEGGCKDYKSEGAIIGTTEELTFQRTT